MGSTDAYIIFIKDVQVLWEDCFNIVVGSISALLSFPVPGVPPREEEGAAAFLYQTAAGRGNRALFIGRISLPQL